MRVHAAAITATELGWDETWVDRAGHERSWPILSHEFSGVVEALGHGATHATTGEAVYGLVPFDHDGAAAEYVAVRARDIAPKPTSLEHTEAATMPLAALTAWQGLTEQARLLPGAHVLVHGAAGGVGSFGVQIAKALGARVSATASARDVEYVRSLGADVVIDYRAEPFEDRVRDVDIVLDVVGGKTAERSVGVLKDGATLVTLPAPPAVTLPDGRGLTARFFIVEPDRSQLIELARMADDGTLRTEVARVFPLEEASEAYAYAREAHPRGKVVLDVSAAE